MKTLLKLIVMLACSLPTIAQEFLPEPYKSVNILPQDMQGWLNVENKALLKQLVERYQPNVIVELGSWQGLSSVYLAGLMKKTGVLYAIDSWYGKGVLKFDAEKPEDKKRIEICYQQFLSNIIHNKLCHKIVPIRMDTLEAARALTIKADLIYVDASHDEESVYNDIMHWYPKLNSGGIMCGDDWIWGSVKKGVQKAAAILHTTIKFSGNCWYFEPLQK